MFKKVVKYDLEKNFEDILEKHNLKMKNSDIAKLYNTSTSSISRLLQSHGIVRKSINYGDTNKIIKEYEKGTTIRKIAKIYNSSESTISKILHDNNVKIRPAYRTTYTLNENYFDVIDTQEKAYILGLLISDGCVYHNTITISLMESDKQILIDVSKLLNSNRPLYYQKSTLLICKNKSYHTKPQYGLSITNKHMSAKLQELGITSNKSLTAEFLECITDKLLPSFIRGVWDGDGFIEKKRYRTGCTGTIMLLSSINEKMNRILDINFSFNKEHCNNDVTYTMKISNKKDCIKFLNYIYKDSTICLQRKYDIYKNYINNSLAA